MLYYISTLFVTQKNFEMKQLTEIQLRINMCIEK